MNDSSEIRPRPRRRPDTSLVTAGLSGSFEMISGSTMLSSGLLSRSRSL